MARENALADVELVRMPLVTLSPLEVNPGDWLTGTVTIKNNTLSSGTKVHVGFLFGTYDSDTGDFDPYEFSNYYYGSVKRDEEVPNKGNTKAVDVKTQALTLISEEITFDILVWVGPNTYLPGTAVYKDSEKRVIGLDKSHFDSYEPYDTTLYEDQVTIAPESKVTGFSIVEG